MSTMCQALNKCRCEDFKGTDVMSFHLTGFNVHSGKLRYCSKNY